APRCAPARWAAPGRAPATPRPRPAPGAQGAARRGAGSSDWGLSSVRSRSAYGLRRTPVAARPARVRAQPSEHPPVVPDRIAALRRLDDLDHPGEARVPHDAPERLRPDRPFADPLVAVQMRPGRALGVVQMQALDLREPDLLVEPLPHLLERRAHIIAGAVQMRRVEAEPRPSLHPAGQRVAQRPQLLERAPERGARARRSFDQDTHLPRNRRQTLGEPAGV